MKDYKTDYLDFCLENKILQFGKHFTLKSGRQSPYFFNSGLFNTGKLIGQVGTYYAKALENEFGTTTVDVLFGPAYKGIPLVIATSIALPKYKYCFNRKETKTYGDGGSLVGYNDIQGKNVIIIDDVMTAGLAVRDSIGLLQNTYKAKVVGVLIALDRMEVGVDSHLSAVQQVSNEFNIPVRSIVSMNDIIDYLSLKSDKDLFPKDVFNDMVAYWKLFGVTKAAGLK